MVVGVLGGLGWEEKGLRRKKGCEGFSNNRVLVGFWG